MEKFMRSFPIKAMQADQPEKGRLKVHVTTEAGAVPVPDARVSVSYTGEQGQPLQEVSTDSSGNTPELELAAPPLEYSVEPSEQQPYSEYTLSVTAPGFEPVEVVGTEILPDVTALQEIRMLPQQGEAYERFVIPAHTLFGNYPPKIAEPEIQPTNETGEIVLSRVVVPEYVIVHDGVPTDSTAANYWVKYRDYIKNVASSEIYATWTDAAIRANVLAIMSFTLNRVYTEFYRNRGYDFTITSSTAFDHKWIPNRNIYNTISQVVDEMFGNYLSRPNVKQPILTQYCDGRRVTCPEWMSRRTGLQRHSDPAQLLWRIHVHQHGGGDLRRALFLARLQSHRGLQGTEGPAAPGTAEPDREGVPGHAENLRGRHLRACHRQFRAGFSVHLRPAGDGHRGLPHLV